tara:strand:+ start:388 stop:735 length:348 start_codon:yes stop_codon:yes gene_type:complete
MEKFQKNIKEWVTLDTQLKKLNEACKVTREKKNVINDDIFNFVNSNNLSSSVIKISDGRLKFSQNKYSPPLSISFLEKCCYEFFEDDNLVGEFLNYVREKRETKIIPDIKRFYDN